MRKVFLLMTTALFSFEALAQTEECVEAPSCTELGYTRTEDECPTGSVKCPWNTGLVYCECAEDYKYACDGDNEKAGDGQCNGLYAACSCADGYKWENGGCVIQPEACEIGSIYYTDGTCLSAKNHDSSKTVLGIVVYVTDDGQHGQIMAPWPVDEDGNKGSSDDVKVMWSSELVDISSLPNITSQSAASKDYDSCGNTDKIVAAGSASTYPAAWAARKYAPTTETAGKWCLPSAGILYNLYRDSAGIAPRAIKHAILKVGGVEYPTCCTWSSSEKDNNGAWQLFISIPQGLTVYNFKNYANPVRPVLEF